MYKWATKCTRSSKRFSNRMLIWWDINVHHEFDVFVRKSSSQRALRWAFKLADKTKNNLESTDAIGYATDPTFFEKFHECPYECPERLQKLVRQAHLLLPCIDHPECLKAMQHNQQGAFRGLKDVRSVFWDASRCICHLPVGFGPRLCEVLLYLLPIC